MKEAIEQNIAILQKAGIGIGTPILGVITSMQDEIMWWLRASSLVVGILVGVASAVSILRGKKKD